MNLVESPVVEEHFLEALRVQDIRSMLCIGVVTYDG
jgi:hypothetical protein